MKNPRHLITGVVGAVIVALCCFTPVLVVLFAAVGLSAWLGYADYILFPALIFFIGLIFYALRHRNMLRNKAADKNLEGKE